MYREELETGKKKDKQSMIENMSVIIRLKFFDRSQLN